VPVQVGVLFPQTEIGADLGALRSFVEAADGLGYRHLVTYEHVLGADPSRHPNWPGPYDLRHGFHEPLVLFGWLSGFTSLEVATGILVGPQRAAALIAKQAAEVDLLCGGRLRLGLGIGWNHVEYEALGQDFATRAARLEEQVALMRLLWTQPSVTFEGRFHTVHGAGILPLPVQRPIPIWLGAHAEAALKRVGRVADGWFPQTLPGPGLDAALSVISRAAQEQGRDPAAIGMEGQVRWATRDLDRLRRHAARWAAGGATHLSVNTMDADCEGVDDHIAALAAMAPALLEG
jgi:probable F420-dependent oxidoreductase